MIRQPTIVRRGLLLSEETPSHATIPAAARLRLGADGAGVPNVGTERARDLFGDHQHEVSRIREQTGAVVGRRDGGDAAALLHRLPRASGRHSLGLRVLYRLAAGGAGGG